MELFTDTTYQDAIDDKEDNRRQSQRRQADSCVAIINGTTHPVANWSQGGVLVHANDKLFSLEQNLEVTLKFRLSNRFVDISQNGQVVRKNNGHLAVKFDPLSKSTIRQFAAVIDDAIAREFAESQV